MNFSTISLSASKKNQRFAPGKVFTSMLLAIMFMVAGQTSWGQVTLPHYEGLNYTVGQGLQAQTNWTLLNSGDDLLIAWGNLSYSGMPASTGSKVTFDGAGIDASKAFTQQTTGTVYYSFLVNVTALGSLNTTGGYFAGFVEGATTNFGGTVWLRSDGAGYDIGINPRTTAANTVWSSGTTALNGTHLVVISYQIVASTGNDVVKLWLDPTWGSAEPAATLTATNTGGTDLVNLNRILLRQDAASATPFVQMDEFRIGLSWQSVASTVNGAIAAGEYGTHTDGQNQNTNSGNVTYMNWDDNNLYVGVSGANIAEGYVLYLDKDPQVPVDGGTNSNGTLIGQNYDGASFANLPWRADLVIYAKNGYREYRTATGSNTWTAATTSFGLYSDNGTVREFSIPWSAIGGRPSSFNFFGYNVSAGGFVYNTQPTANATGAIGTSARYERYYTVSTTTIGSSTPPFSRNSYVFNNTADENGFGTINVYDFTMNSSGRFISKTGQTTQSWTIGGNLVVGNGTIYFGSGGTNGAYGTVTVSGDLDVRGGALNMDQTTGALTVNGNLSLSGGTLQLSGNAFGGGDLVLKGNWSNTGGTFTPSSRAVFLNGTSAQSITKPVAETFDYLIVDNTANISAANGITVNQVLTLTNGTVSGGTVAVSNSATAAVVRTNGYVISNLQRAVATGTNTYDYAIGTSSGYTPVSIAFSGTTGAGNVTVASINGASSNYPPSLSATKRLARYWSVTNSGVSGFTAGATFNYLGADLVGGATSATIHPYKFDAPSTFSDPSFTAGTNTFTATGLSSFSEFGAGECTTVCQNGGILDVQTCGCQCLSGYSGFNCQVINRSITTSVTGTTFCAGDALTVDYNAIAPVAWNGGNIFTAELSDASGSFTSPVNIGSVSSTATGLGSISAIIPLGTSFGSGYRIRVVSSDPVVTGTDNGTDLTINPNYTITASAGAGGAIAPGGVTTLCEGANQTYTIIAADACHAIADVVVDGVSQGPVGAYTFTNVTANHTINATFAVSTYTITVIAGANGSITPATGSVNCGDNATYTITADACYSIADVVVDGVSQGAVGTYTFTNVTAAHTISATFVLNTYTITVTAGANGSITPATGSVNCGDNATYTITPDACYSIADVVVDGVSQGAVGTYTFTNVTANHTISATFSLNTYTITVTAGANGSITPATGSVNCGDNATYTITADACYSIADVVVDGSSQGAVGTYTFTNVTANHTISATFVLNTYTITVTAGANGSITPATGSVNCGDNATYTITPDACYSIADVVVDGSSQGAVGTYTFTNVTANHTISATFVLNTYTITVTAGANGSITPATGSVNCGDNATYTITADACYSIADVVVDGSSQGAVGTYTFTNVTANHTISATFVLNTYTITVTAGANGSITPATGSVNCGDNATYTITPDACYAIADVVVDGVSQGAVGTYTFTNLTANHTISATFAATTYTITVTAGANGSITPATGSVNCGDNATYTITPDACYSIADVVVDGVSQGAVGTYTFTNVTANHTISATFSLNTYTITVTAGANGSITPATGSVNCGDNATYTITPDACYSIADVIVDGVSQGAVGTYSFTNVTANHTISATFVLTTYTITVTAGANGSITPGTGSVNCGDNATYTITADACYTIADVIVDGVSQGAVGTYTFTNVTANHTISATFTQITYTITASTGSNGTVTPAGASIVNCGTNAAYTITPDACYHVLDVLVDAVSVGAVTSYTFTNVTANHTISATFAINSPVATPVVTGPVNVCPYVGTGTPVTYTATSAGATGFTWVVPPTNVTIVSGQGTANLTVTFQNGFIAQGNKQLKVTATSACGNSSQFIYYLVAQVPGTPQPIVASSSNVCAVIGTPGTITYTINAVQGAASYNWSAQAGTTVINHPNGPGMNDTTVTVSFTNGFTSSNISVSASSAGCGTGGTRSLLITRANPSTPGLISGPTNACPYMAPGGTPATYSVVLVPNATSYTWTVPAGAIGLTGQGTNTISFTYPNGFVSGTVTVLSSNGCGNSGVRSLSISKLNPATPSIIDVIQTQPCPNREYTYTLSGMPANATSVQWTVPVGATLVSGQGSISITVSYPPIAFNSSVTAQAFNNCGSSTIRTSAVHIPVCPLERTPIAKGGSTITTPVESMQVNVYPNPTVNDFKLQVTTAGKDVINVRILDLQGRELKHFVVNPYQTTNVGSDLKGGTYMVEVKQGNTVKVTKLIKF